MGIYIYYPPDVIPARDAIARYLVRRKPARDAIARYLGYLVRRKPARDAIARYHE